MAVMVLALSVTPCMDDACSKTAINSQAQIAVSHNTHEHSSNDLCSPFCTCNCCSGFTFFSTPIQIQHTIFAPAKMYPSYLPSTIIEISLPIWQPPQLS